MQLNDSDTETKNLALFQPKLKYSRYRPYFCLNLLFLLRHHSVVVWFHQ